MFTFPPFGKILSATAGLALLAFSGCDEKSGSPTSPAPAKSEAAVPAAPAVKSAEPTSFDAVTAHLDRGGSLYFYLSTEQWLAGLSQQIGSLRELVISATAGQQQTASQAASIDRAFSIATDLVKKSGIEKISGVGGSSIAVEPGVYRNQFFVHHGAENSSGFLMTAFGKTPHPLTALDILPTDTALATFGDFDLAQIVGIIRQAVDQSGIPEAKAAVDQAVAQFPTMAGMTLDEALNSLGGSGGMIVTLDPAKPLSLPIPGQQQTIPTPRIAFVLAVKDDRIFKQIDNVFSANLNVVRVDEEGLKMRTIAIPTLPQLIVRATAAQWGERLIIASDDRLVRDLIAAQKEGRGYKSTPEFAKLSAGLPTEGNGFQIGTQAFADIWNQVQKQMMTSQPGMTPQQMAMFEKFMFSGKPGPSYSVSAHLADGWLSAGKSSLGSSQMLAPLLIAPVAVAAGMAVPVFQKTSEKAKSAKSISNSKQIALGCILFAQDHDGKFPATLHELVPDYLPDAKVFASPFAPGEPMGYTYTPGLTTSSPATHILLEDKNTAISHEKIVAHPDGSAAATPAP